VPGDAPYRREPRRVGFLAGVAIGLGAALIGLLPWIATGMRLPLQNLWAVEVRPEDMPVALLPLSNYAVTLLAGLLILGWAVGGLAGRLLSDRRKGWATRGIAVGLLLAQGAAAAQSAVVLRDGLQEGGAATLYLAALIAVVVVSVVLGAAVLALAARAAMPGATIAFAVGALAAGIWLNSLIAPFGTIDFSVREPLLHLARWVPAVLVGVAIAWCGFRTVGRVVGVVVSLLALWIGPASITAVSAAAGSRVLLPYPAEMLDYARGVFGMAVTMPELVVPPLAVALLVGVLGAVALRVRAARRPSAAAPPAEA
jgi:hypothetical protein